MPGKARLPEEEQQRLRTDSVHDMPWNGAIRASVLPMLLSKNVQEVRSLT
jgi:hypothetical protein